MVGWLDGRLRGFYTFVVALLLSCTQSKTFNRAVSPQNYIIKIIHFSGLGLPPPVLGGTCVLTRKWVCHAFPKRLWMFCLPGPWRSWRRRPPSCSSRPTQRQPPAPAAPPTLTRWYRWSPPEATSKSTNKANVFFNHINYAFDDSHGVAWEVIKESNCGIAITVIWAVPASMFDIELNFFVLCASVNSYKLYKIKCII